MSTIDYSGQIACVVFLRGCNFRCGFCHNPELVLGDDKQGVEFSERDVLEFLSRRLGKLDAVVISGGEPLLSLSFDFVRKIKSMGFKIKIDTNGTSPGKLRELIDEKLIDCIAMDVKGCAEDYSKICGIDVDVWKIEESMRIVDEFGRGDGMSEFRTTVVGRFHDLERLKMMGEWMNGVLGRKPKMIFLQGFRRSDSGMIDSDFLRERDVVEEVVLEMRDGVLDLFEGVGIRC